jgi:uncharacterized membrane protein YqhA
MDTLQGIMVTMLLIIISLAVYDRFIKGKVVA